MTRVAVPQKVSVAKSVADIDDDGDPDLFVTTVRRGNHLFENLGGGRFRDITDAAGVGYRGHSSGAVFFDYDRDGLLDLFVANVGRYTTNVVGGEEPGHHVAYEDAFSGHLKPERAERSILYRTRATAASWTPPRPVAQRRAALFRTRNGHTHRADRCAVAIGHVAAVAGTDGREFASRSSNADTRQQTRRVRVDLKVDAYGCASAARQRWSRRAPAVRGQRSDVRRWMPTMTSKSPLLSSR